MTHKIAFKSMTPLDKVFMLSTEDTLNEAVRDAHGREVGLGKGGRRAWRLLVRRLGSGQG
mgnify:CR=1 FL=1